jgi:hypothetical protein
MEDNFLLIKSTIKDKLRLTLEDLNYLGTNNILISDCQKKKHIKFFNI